MSEKALRDLNSIPGSERRNENSSKGSIAKPVVSSTNGNLEEGQKKTNGNLEEGRKKNNGNIEEGQKQNSVNGSAVKSGAEIGNLEVEYIESENLNDVEDADTSLKVCCLLLVSILSNDNILRF